MASDNKVYVVNGYEFYNEKDYNDALNECKGVKYINEQIEAENPKKIRQIYCQLIEKNIFTTQIGLEYLHKMRKHIAKDPALAENLPNVPVHTETEENLKNRIDKRKAVEEMKSVEKSQRKIKERLRTSIIINIVLFIVVIVMFIVASNTSTPNILNYERKLQDKYSSWAEELQEKEDDLRAREKTLEQ